jgi:hypothetical protein
MDSKNVVFYSATEENEILSFTDKMIFSRLRRPKTACSLSYVEYRPNTNAAIL